MTDSPTARLVYTCGLTSIGGPVAGPGAPAGGPPPQGPALFPAEVELAMGRKVI
jgi:hypothetical protein